MLLSNVVVGLTGGILMCGYTERQQHMVIGHWSFITLGMVLGEDDVSHSLTGNLKVVENQVINAWVRALGAMMENLRAM
jgi:hypothetical protein